MLADYLWLHMSATYGHRWTSAYGEDPRGVAGRVWASELAGMSREQIDEGLASCRAASDPWPPSLPQFKGACLGVPSLAFVRDDVTRAPEHRDAFTRLVWSFVDAYRIKAASADQSDRMLRDAYDLAREHVMRGGSLPGAHNAVTKQDRPAPAVPPEVAQARFAEARVILSGKDRAAGRDS